MAEEAALPHGVTLVKCMEHEDVVLPRGADNVARAYYGDAEAGFEGEGGDVTAKVRELATAHVYCSNAHFSDPAPGREKSLWIEIDEADHVIIAEESTDDVVHVYGGKAAIRYAWYGDKDRVFHADAGEFVTDKVREMATDEDSDIPADNGVFGDTCPGKVKVLAVALDGGTQVHTGKEGAVIDITGSGGAIRRAWWGADDADPWGADGYDVTKRVRELAQPGKIDVSNGTFGDTAPGVLKALFIEMDSRGRRVLRATEGTGEKIRIDLMGGHERITNAWYGPKAAPWHAERGDTVTDKAKELGAADDLRGSNDQFGDTAPGEVKVLLVEL